MTKSELIALANKGKQTLCGVTANIIIRPDSDGEDWIEIEIEPLSPLHQPLRLGDKWVKFITDDECAELEPAIERYKKSAAKFFKDAQRVVKATVQDGQLQISELPEDVKSDWDFIDVNEEKERYIKRFCKLPHPVSFIGKGKTYFRALGVFTLDIDGHLYVPRWSYWLDCPYYLADDFIREKCSH